MSAGSLGINLLAEDAPVLSRIVVVVVVDVDLDVVVRRALSSAYLLDDELTIFRLLRLAGSRVIAKWQHYGGSSDNEKR